MTQGIDTTREVRLNTWSRAADVFSDVVMLPLHERSAALDERCGADVALRRFVEAMLAADDGMPDTRSDVIARGVNRVLGHLVLDVEPGRRFGAFAVVEEIGHGGMGVVYLAERRDGTVAQRVALKLVAHGHLDAEASARLARERRVLAALEHPNIARLIDAGEDPTGIPYFAMEYVKGLPITQYCDEHALSLPDRLRLFRQVCSAVQYAHANLVVHCDIKAGNILVTENGLPKLLDFGIATTLGADAPESSRFFLSPQSAAPEQFVGQPASIPTDVYALGVLLCQLTGGQLPFDGDDSPALRDRVLNASPRLPSEAAPARRRQLRGDIDEIVAKALSKAPQDRYASVEQLDADVARHLATRPIAIRANERSYRAWTFVRRNVLPVSLATVLAILAIGFSVVTLRQNESLAYERDQAQQRESQAEYERSKAQQITEFLVGLFRASKPEETHGREVTARQLLERGRQQLANNLSQQPLLKAAMLAAIAEASYALDDLQGSFAAAKESLELLDSLSSPPRRDLAVTLGALIRIENELGYRDEAATHGERALSLEGDMDVAWRVNFLEERARTLVFQARKDDAVLQLRRAMALQEESNGRNDMRLMHLALKLSMNLPDAEGEKVLAKYLPSDDSQLNADDPRYGDVLNGLAYLWRMRGDLDRAEKYAQKGILFFTKVNGADSSRVAAMKTTMVLIANAREDYPRALQLAKEVLDVMRRTYGETPDLARTEYNVGSLLVGMKRTREALPYLQRAVEIGSSRPDSRSDVLAFFRRNLAMALCELGQYEAAETQVRLSIALYEQRKEAHETSSAVLACVLFKRDGNPSARADLSAWIDDLSSSGKSSRDSMTFLRNCLSGAH